MQQLVPSLLYVRHSAVLKDVRFNKAANPFHRPSITDAPSDVNMTKRLMSISCSL